jgi:hypothetical protein
MPQLFAGMRDPPHRARHGKQHQFMAGRQAERVHQHRKRIIDIDELAGRFGDAVKGFRGCLRSAPERASASSSPARGSPCL